MTTVITYFPTRENLCVFLWHESKWPVCFFGDLCCSELDLEVNFEYRIQIWYIFISKNSGIEPAYIDRYRIILVSYLLYKITKYIYNINF